MIGVAIHPHTFRHSLPFTPSGLKLISAGCSCY